MAASVINNLFGYKLFVVYCEKTVPVERQMRGSGVGFLIRPVISHRFLILSIFLSLYWILPDILPDTNPSPPLSAFSVVRDRPVHERSETKLNVYNSWFYPKQSRSPLISFGITFTVPIRFQCLLPFAWVLADYMLSQSVGSFRLSRSKRIVSAVIWGL